MVFKLIIEDATMLYSLEKRTEADLNWDDVSNSSFGGFTSDIDRFLDWLIE